MNTASVLAALPARQRAEALWLLCSLFKVSKSEILFNARDEWGAEATRTWRQWWLKRDRGVPLQYIAGEAPFYGRDFAVDRRVLIPRPETERLVELALGLIEERVAARVLDIGTGSGVIAITLKLERPTLEVAGSDLSAPALAVAAANADRLGAAIRLEKHDLFSKKLRGERWDLVVSNPPYLDFRKDKIAGNVKKWEPKRALEPGLASRRGPLAERAAWCAEKILGVCAVARPAFTALELSPRVAFLLERRWRGRPGVKRIWRAADLAGRKRFLLVAWGDG